MDDQKLLLLEDDNCSFDENPPISREFEVGRRILFCAINNVSKDSFKRFLKKTWRKNDTVIIVYCPDLPKNFKNELLAAKSSERVMRKLNKKICKTTKFYKDLCTEKEVKFKLKVSITDEVGKALCQFYKSEHAVSVAMPVRRFFGSSSDKSLCDYVFEQLGLQLCTSPS